MGLIELGAPGFRGLSVNQSAQNMGCTKYEGVARLRGIPTVCRRMASLALLGFGSMFYLLLRSGQVGFWEVGV